ncbi:hypothetical protein NFB50_16305 [Yersinia ruckeri]|uniref:hypothetical protein n=1 Tax=Yersinia ruckeri TaxID=29486 RepID=UPI0020BF8AA3|nr:hypothetical protein [Yersinia ruckeri]MCW6560021.1 hypothetical protein [Yersinia ruckeri]MCW6596056.1 hypothetical protein [Yersinia ruckeri]UZY16895.1 hypothetical protein LNQ37_017455 [Yersinia ruckeri]HDM8387172.1 hypothetical protein [Yersinia enterocolitica]
MDKLTREYIHRFRNALVIASETRSFECYNLPRWQELNSFPHGSCDLASNFLARYLDEKGYATKIVHINNSSGLYSDIKSHVFVLLNDYYIDLTLSQFSNYICNRVIIEKINSGMLSELMKKCREEDQRSVSYRNVNIDDAVNIGTSLYLYIKKIADAL